MNFYDFIFSDQRRIRFRRHLFFWIAWVFYFALTYLTPTYWVLAWNFNGPMPQIEKYGIGVSILRILMNTVLMTVVHMALVYSIIYYILPRYLSKNRNPITTTAILILITIVLAFINYFAFLPILAISTHLGYFSKMPGMNYIIPLWVRQVIFNYPTIVGFAVAIKLLKRWWLKQKETEQLTKEKINAELQLLKSQIHPHFLFNTLNNLYSFILKGSPQAPEMVKKLSSLLNYILNECNQPLVSLEKELSLLQDYMALERIRYGDVLSMSLHIEGNPKGKMISPLLLIPFVENSFKHGTSRMLAHPWVKLDIAIEDHTLSFQISNNKPERSNDSFFKKGIGLNNVKKRLHLLYPGKYSLNIVENAMTYDVSMKIHLHVLSESPSENTLKEKETYELV